MVTATLSRASFSKLACYPALRHAQNGKPKVHRLQKLGPNLAMDSDALQARAALAGARHRGR
jgi:hypothetical protein